MSRPLNKFEELLTRVRSGCPEAARELYDQYGKCVLRVIRRRLQPTLRRQFDSADFVQMVMASAFADNARAFTFESPEQMINFLCSLATNKVVEETRRQYGAVRNVTRVIEASSDAPESDPIRVARDHRTSTPSQKAMAGERWDAMVDGQPPALKLVLQLLREGYTYEEVSERTGLHRKAIQRFVRTVHEGMSA